MVAIELVLSEWLYRAILGHEVLTLNRDYFRLSGGLERRLYELARKHCGHQSRWTISLPVLHTKSGAASVLFRFRQMIKTAAAANALPDYTTAIAINLPFMPERILEKQSLASGYRVDFLRVFE